jgi:hypothetical protein
MSQMQDEITIELEVPITVQITGWQERNPITHKFTIEDMELDIPLWAVHAGLEERITKAVHEYIRDLR